MAFSSGRLEVMDMVRLGSILNVLGVLAVLLVLNTTGSWLFALDTVPEWAHEHMRAAASGNATNATCVPQSVVDEYAHVHE